MVTHRRGPLLVLAGPGSGKTRVITCCIAYRVRHDGAAPERLLAITFTNRAANEMRRRVGDLLGENVRVPIGTFHWVCSAFLRRYADRLGFRRNFRLLSPAEARAALRTVVPNDSSAGALMRAISAVKNGANAQDASKTQAISLAELRTTLDAYNGLLKRMDALDLDDLLLRSASLLRSDETVRHAVSRRFDMVLVDEYQDTNPVQAEIVRLMAPVDRTVIAVGDDDQAIYEWRQAGGGARLFEAAFPDAETVVLGETYRSTKHILRAASSLIAHNARRSQKRLITRRPAGERPVSFVAQDENEEAEWVSKNIEALVAAGISYSEIGVLYRVHAQSRALEDALVRHDIPYRILAGRRFYERPEIQRVLAYLRVALDPGDDVAAEQLARGVVGMGDVRIHTVHRYAAETETSFLAAMEHRYSPHEIPVSTLQRLHAVGEQARSIIRAREKATTIVAEKAIDATRLDLEARATDRETLRENLDELLIVVRELEAQRGTLRGLIDRLTVQSDEHSGVQGVSLMSLHAAKGLEFSVVFLTGLEEGLLPHRRAMDREEDVEAERRLAYVGVTRARDRLFLSHSQMRFLSGHSLLGGTSRFLQEIGPSNLTVEISKESKVRPRLTSAHPGERVKHPRWGMGTVVSVEGKGRDTLITISFDGSGRRRLQLCHAPLTRSEHKDDTRVR